MDRKPRKKDVTYTAVADFCSTLNATPTLTQLQEGVGGSYTTLTKFLRQWEEEQRMNKQSETELSAACRHALLAELDRVADATRQLLNEQLAHEKTRLQEAHDRMGDLETQIEQLEADQAVEAQRQVTLREALAAAKALTEASVQREQACQVEIKALRDALHQGEIQIAITAERNRRLEQDVQDLKAQGKKAAS